MAGTDHDRYHNQSFTCVNVVDGDTIDIDVPDGEYDTTRIRLWGVDTPETGKGGTQRMYFGDEATAFTKSFVLDESVRVVLAGNEGEFPKECDKEVFARIERPFQIKDIGDCIEEFGIAGREVA